MKQKQTTGKAFSSNKAGNGPKNMPCTSKRKRVPAKRIIPDVSSKARKIRIAEEAAEAAEAESTSGNGTYPFAQEFLEMFRCCINSRHIARISPSASSTISHTFFE